MAVTIRDSAGRDRADILALLSSGGLPVSDVDSSGTLRFLVAEMDGAVVGCIGREVHGPHALLRSFAVAADLRNSGVGSTLFREAESRCRSEGVREVYLFTTTAEAFFSRRGFARLDRKLAPAAIQSTSEFTSTCPVSAAFMAKRL
ncbi:MAG: arsenic resistance N-acetyltransferase ArsN2 [Dehalococcoidia bacterium]|jgi:amino-acid N-acetyltransferase|nr:arsenic resistance N-acetyltransferase ArsN2 [Dehalococcoidia bacterium]